MFEQKSHPLGSFILGGGGLYLGFMIYGVNSSSCNAICHSLALVVKASPATECEQCVRLTPHSEPIPPNLSLHCPLPFSLLIPEVPLPPLPPQKAVWTPAGHAAQSVKAHVAAGWVGAAHFPPQF